MDQLEQYAAEEERGGFRYHCHPLDPSIKAPRSVPGGEMRVHLFGYSESHLLGHLTPFEEVVETLSATETLARARDGLVPLCRWQCHLFARK